MFLRQKKWLIVLVLSVSILSFYFFLPVLNAVKIVAVKVVAVPFVVCRGIGQRFRGMSLLIEENEALRKKTGDLSLKIARLDNVREENERLRALLRFKKGFGFETISAEVIARDPVHWTGVFVIDRGTGDGIKKQIAVCSAKGLLGKVVQAGGDTSFVIPLTHPGFKAGGVIKGTRINGAIPGVGKGRARMLYMPMDADVNKGETVITSGLSRIFPEGILIGEVVAVHKSRTGLYKYADVKPFADLFNEEEVLCIIE